MPYGFKSRPRYHTALVQMKRRDLLCGASAAWATSRLGRTAEPPSPAGVFLDGASWNCLAAVQDHLLPPAPGVPGSRDIAATAYLDRTLADDGFDPDIRDFLLQGVGWLEEIARQQEGEAFHRLRPARREELLRQIAATQAGERWISTLLTYTLEALLADPLYGGNPGGVGWKWLEHHPGRPRPTPDTLYGRLGRT